MTHFLVTFNDNWSDEMDLEGFFYEDAESEEELRTRFKKGMDEVWRKTSNGGFIWSCGSNQEIDYTSTDQALENYEIEPLSDNDYEVLK